MTLRYEAKGFDIRLRITLTGEPGVSDWALSVTNTGDAPRDFLTGFPCMDGIRLGAEPSKNLATAMDQGGLVVPAWERRGGVLGESNQLSMQWHAVWDPASKSALGVIFMDADVRPKRLILSEPRLEVQYFPPARLAPGASMDFPRARVLVYKGDWRPAARAYRAWYGAAYPHLDPPDWFRRSDGEIGKHFKYGAPGTAPSWAGQHVIQSWRELPGLQLANPVDAWEYAFYCHSSMVANDKEYTPHTDGENVIREDLGGAAAMREGIAGVHRVGLHTILYVEGYLMYGECDLGRTGAAQRWAITHKDGTQDANYTKQGFYHMCPGCVEWQDHLASMVARLFRETNADGVRLDSLGFYYRPCYNPGHHHATPFGYNEWLKQLLTKVRAAAVAVKPDALLLTEGSADWLGPYVHGALTSRCPRELSLMRIAVGPFRPYVYASGTLWASLSGFAGSGGGGDMRDAEWNWTCAQDAVHEALVWGEAKDDPVLSDPEIVARCFEGPGYLAVPVARPASSDPIWPRGTKAAAKRARYTLTIADGAGVIADGALCDVESLTWAPLKFERKDGNIQFSHESNWALVVLRKRGGPSLVTFDALPPTPAGGAVKVQLTPLTGVGERPLRAKLIAPGLDAPMAMAPVPGAATLRVPDSALPGNYAVRVQGEGILGLKRFLVVPKTP
ncbi:MAG: hypothetical protein HZB26_10330 [Candidatus Hydrogenedentes bacterium]|nr:hypothetical protein [Candidatus Hydrogenedentota bacterium]